MKCPMKSLFERIGGKTAVLATVTKLYGKILEDKN
jgi:truncated hemoglobin YjbI